MPVTAPAPAAAVARGWPRFAWILLLVVAAGCSSATTTRQGIDGGVITHAGDDGGGSGDDAASAEDGVSSASCPTQPTTEACVTCCASANDASYQRFIAAVEACECGSSGVCQSPCATSYCASTAANPTPGDACSSCLTSSLEEDAGGQCLGPVSTACPPGGACDAYLNCTDACP